MSAIVRHLILSDIHANLPALEAVLTAAKDDWDDALVLGDLVGYGADPNAVIDRVRDLRPLAIIRGNHDKAACGLDTGEQFNHVARYAARWTEQQLTPRNREFLQTLPPGPADIDDRLQICHGAPFDEDYYIFDGVDARRAFELRHRPVCVFGHTHLPAIFVASTGSQTADLPESGFGTLALRDDATYLVNPGSVGQPRDGDPRAAFAIYDSGGTFEFKRVAYNVAETQRRIAAAGLPQSLANRLAIGR